MLRVSRQKHEMKDDLHTHTQHKNNQGTMEAVHFIGGNPNSLRC
jgi:hypothetical protein